MCNRCVLAVNLSDFVLEPAGVGPDAVDVFLRSILGGAHSTLDTFFETALEESFSVKDIRTMTALRAPFLEVLINNSKIAHLGLTPKKIHDMEQAAVGDVPKRLYPEFFVGYPRLSGVIDTGIEPPRVEVPGCPGNGEI
jgi:hypothetical protein